MSFYADMRATATRLLTQFGASATLTARTAGAYDPADSEATVTETESTVKAVLFDYPERAIDGTSILRGDKKAFIQAGGTKPKAGMFLTWGEVVHSIVDCKPLSPSGYDVLYEAQVRA